MEADPLGLCEGDDSVVVREEVGLSESELVVEDVEELALYPADVALAKDTCAERPVDVLQGRVVAVLREIEVSVWSEYPRARSEMRRTLLARMSAPKNTRSHAHCSRAI